MRVRRLVVVVVALVLGSYRALEGASTSQATSQATASRATSQLTSTAQWGLFEAAFLGPSDGNPFVDVDFLAQFTSADGKSVTARGFYDGGGTYRVRFMPPTVGTWRFVTHSNRKELNNRSGEFIAAKANAGNHGPVRVARTYHFAYADGTPFVPIGTTCYTWVHQPADVEERTLASLKASEFNKVRMCVFPTAYKVGTTEPVRFPYQRGADGKFDLTRFDVEFFRHLEERVLQMDAMGIQADLILFHPYDKGQMGFDRMSAVADELYLRYLVARLSAHRNVWWSMANEFDLMREKTDADFDRAFRIVQSEDPSEHLRSIHNSGRYYDQGKAWVTHVSAQNGSAVDDFGRAVQYRDIIGKPVIYDEAKYEGDIDRRWGQLSGEAMTMHFWLATIGGTYGGHGEVWKAVDSGPIWTGRGGELRGASPKRIAFLKSILADAPAEGIDPIDRYYESHVGGKAGEYYLIYFGREKPTEWTFELPRQALVEGMTFAVDVLDTWEMTTTAVEGPAFKIVKRGGYAFGAEGDRKIPLPGKQWMAVRVRRTDRIAATSAPVNEAE